MDKPTPPETEEPLDAVSAASRWSKVSKKNTAQKNRSWLYWLIGGAGAVILVLMWSAQHATGQQQAQTSNRNSSGYQTALNANLAHLRALAQQQQTVAKQVAYPSERVLTRVRHSKKYLARQNAPTNMYSSPAIPGRSPQAGGRVQQATFAGRGANDQFANTPMTTDAIEAVKIPHPGYTLASGELLHGVLETAIDSDLPGMVRAVVSKPVYSYTDERTLIPAGSRLIGQYRSALIQGQNRVMIIWNRVVLPSGIAVQINSPGTDRLGRAGLRADRVNTHFLARFGEAALLSIIGAGTATVGVGTNDRYNSAAQYRMAIAQSFQQSANQSLQGTLPRKPTLQIDQGAKITVFVAHDLSFYRVLKDAIELKHPMPSFIK